MIVHELCRYVVVLHQYDEWPDVSPMLVSMRPKNILEPAPNDLLDMKVTARSEQMHVVFEWFDANCLGYVNYRLSRVAHQSRTRRTIFVGTTSGGGGGV